MFVVSIEEIKKLSKKYGFFVGVLFYQLPGGSLCFTSYGDNKFQCDRIKAIADKIYDSWIDGEFSDVDF